ncbi:unnamed protein product [Polarella glacialis]|uniref:Uncharacterized protein n=1 Tax=Polarella glacialis TaxID=89957 RepID=A0A813H5D1_POLGL|nr:unnamed protein product [Polarella glacialis]
MLCVGLAVTWRSRVSLLHHGQLPLLCGYVDGALCTSSTSIAVDSLIRHLSIYESLADAAQCANCKSAGPCWQAVDLATLHSLELDKQLLESEADADCQNPM